MRTVTIIQMLALTVFIAGCLDSTENISRNREEKRMQIEMDHSQCVSYGFPPKSIEYANCRKKLDQQKIEMEEQEKLNIQNIEGQEQSTSQAKSRNGKICNKNHCY